MHGDYCELYLLFRWKRKRGTDRKNIKTQYRYNPQGLVEEKQYGLELMEKGKVIPRKASNMIRPEIN